MAFVGSFKSEVMDVGDAHESRGIRFRRLKMHFFSVEPGEIAGHVIDPVTGLGRGKADDESAVGVAEGVHEERSMAWGAELGAEFYVGWVFGRFEVEDEVAGGPSGCSGARGLGENRGRQ